MRSYTAHASNATVLPLQLGHGAGHLAVLALPTKQANGLVPQGMDPRLDRQHIPTGIHVNLGVRASPKASPMRGFERTRSGPLRGSFAPASIIVGRLLNLGAGTGNTSRSRRSPGRVPKAAGQVRDVTVEHLMPPNRETHWPLPSDTDSEAGQRRSDSLNRLGNLTSSSQKLKFWSVRSCQPRRRSSEGRAP